MMKKTVMGLMIAFAACTVQASYLYWQVDTADYSSVYSGDAVGATLYAVNGNSTYSQNATIGNTFAFDLGSTDWTGYSFYIEVARSAGDIVATTEGDPFLYSALGNYIQTTMTSVAQAQVWHGGTYAVPEPTTGLMLWVGLALLGLKRKHV